MSITVSVLLGGKLLGGKFHVSVAWFHFQIALMYMCSRLIVNVSQTYWPLYLTDSLQLTKVGSFDCLSVIERAQHQEILYC